MSGVDGEGVAWLGGSGSSGSATRSARGQER
jgi:hypothetical protein